RSLVARGRGGRRRRGGPAPRAPRAGERQSLTPLTRESVRDLVAGTVLSAIGDTPLVPLRRIGTGLRGELWVKLESLNPGGSVKDAAALWMAPEAAPRAAPNAKTPGA